MIDYVDMKNGHEKKITLAECFDNITPDLTYRMATNPLAGMGILAERELLAVDTYFFRNSYALRGFIRSIIQEKRLALDDGASEDDVLALLL